MKITGPRSMKNKDDQEDQADGVRYSKIDRDMTGDKLKKEDGRKGRREGERDNRINTPSCLPGGEQTGHYPGSAEAGRGKGDSWNSRNITIISCVFYQPWSSQSASKDNTIIENTQQQRGGVTILFQVNFFFIYVSIIINPATRKPSIKRN